MARAAVPTQYHLQPIVPEINPQTCLQHFFTLGEADGFARESFQMRSQIQIEPLNMAGVRKTNPMQFFRDQILVGHQAIRAHFLRFHSNDFRCYLL